MLKPRIIGKPLVGAPMALEQLSTETQPPDVFLSRNGCTCRGRLSPGTHLPTSTVIRSFDREMMRRDSGKEFYETMQNHILSAGNKEFVYTASKNQAGASNVPA